MVSLLAADGWCADKIAEQVTRLDDDRFAVREAAKLTLMKIGEPAVAQLVEATGSDSPEKRSRARAVLHSIRLGTIARGFEAIGKCADEDIDVERGMVLIAQMIDPEVTAEAIGAELDKMAAAVRKSVGEGVEPKSLPGEEVIAKLTGVLKEQYGLAGDTENYDHPHNSSIHRVMAEQNGLPIMLSEIAVAVGRRLGVPVVGVPVPGRYMFKYDGARAPLGKPKRDIIVDPYGGWDVLEPEEIAQGRRFFDPAEDLAAARPRATLERMLNNLESDCEVIGRRRMAGAVRRFQDLTAAGTRVERTPTPTRTRSAGSTPAHPAVAG